jgi:hypothetical protein
MALVVMQRDVVPLGYRIETTWGVDPLAGNLPILGLVRRCRITVRQNREARRGVGSGIDPLLFTWKEHQISVDLEYEVQNEIPTNSRIALALGSAPNGVTGVITNWPAGTDRNLRTYTLEAGYDWPNADEFYQVKGLMTQRLEIDWTDDTLIFRENLIGKSVGVPTTAPAMTAPSLSMLEVFDAFEDGTLAFASPTISDVFAERWQVVIENTLRHSGIVGGGRSIGYLQLAGRNVFVPMNLLKTGSGFVSLFYTAPNLAAANVDITATISKNAAAEFIKATLTNCEIVDEQGVEYTDEEAEVKETWRLQAKSYAFDVVTP